MQEFCVDIENWKTYKMEFLWEIFNLSNKKSEVCFKYISNFKNTKILRDIIAKVCDIYWIEDIWKNRLILIVDELNNNAIEYGSNFWDLNKLILKVENNKKSIIFNIEVHDSWLGKLAKTAENMEEIRNEKRNIDFVRHKSIRWRWLFLIIDKLVDEIYFNNWEKWGLIVWINKTINKK